MNVYEFGLIASIFLVIIAIGVYRTRKYYGRMFGDPHLQVLHEALLSAWSAALDGQPEAVPSPDLGTAFVTYGDVGVGVTATTEDDGEVLHISFSQISRVTTAAAGRLIGAFIVGMLDPDVEPDIYSTPSRVHHIRVVGTERPTLEHSFQAARARAETLTDLRFFERETPEFQD